MVHSGGCVADWTTMNGHQPKRRFLGAIHRGLLCPVGPFSSLPLMKIQKVNSQSIEANEIKTDRGYVGLQMQNSNYLDNGSL